MIVFNPIWEDVVSLVGLEHGVTLTPLEIDWLLWERTSYPFVEPLKVVRQLHEEFEHPKTETWYFDE